MKGRNLKIKLVFFLITLLMSAVSYAQSTGNADPIQPLVDALTSGRNEGLSHKSKSYIFTGKLDRTVPYASLPDGSVQELRNMRRPAPGIPMGWTARAGVTKHNTTTIGASTEVKGIYQINNTDLGFNKYFTHADDSFYRLSSSPPDESATIGTSIYAVKSGASPLFCDRIGEDLVCASTGTTPFAYSGASAYPDAVYVHHESGASVFDSGWRYVRDNREDTALTWVQRAGTTEYAYIGFRRRISAVTFDIVSGTGNALASGTTVSAYRGGVWTQVSGLVDGTAQDATGVTTLYQSGTVSWTESASDTPHVLIGTKDHLFWYRFNTTADVTDGIKVHRIRVDDRCESITSLWSGLYNTALGFLVETSGVTDYTAEITAGTDSEYADLSGVTTCYVGFATPAFGFWLNTVANTGNSGTTTTMSIYYWKASTNAWTEITGKTDGTSSEGMSMNHPGIVQWDGQGLIEDARSLAGRITPLYWYKIVWSTAIPSGVQLWEVGQLEKPDTIPPMPEYDGVFEYNGRAAFWPGVKYRHGIDFSQDTYPHIMTGPKTSSTGNIFGPGIPNAAVRFSSYAVVSTKNPYRLYLLEGKVPGKFDELLISDKVGAIAPHSMIAVEDAVKIFQTTRVVHAVALLAPNGVFLTQGQNVVNISQPIADYWDTNNDEYIEPAYAYLSYAWVDYQNKTLHFAVPMHLSGGSTQTTLNRELVYSYISDEWYDQYKRYSPARCGSDIIGSDDKRIVMLGDYAGTLYRAGVSTTDAGEIIEHYVKTADIIPATGGGDAFNYSSILRAIKTKTKVSSVGDIEVLVYPDGKTSGVTPSVTTIGMSKTGYGYSYGRVNVNEKGESFALRFRSGVSSAETGSVMEIHGFSLDYYPLRDTQVGGN